MTYENDGLPLSLARRRLARTLAVEEVAAVYRHDLTGKLGAARMLAYTLRKRMPESLAPAEAEARYAETTDLLESSLKAALDLLQRHLVAGGASDEHDPADVTDVATELVKGVARVRVVAAHPVWVDADADEIAVALAELVENGLEASRGVVEVSVTERDGKALAAVTDDGPGLPESLEETPPLTSPKAGRLGLGLRIARRVAKRWQGTVEARREGDHTVVTLELPAIRGEGSRSA